ncbi:Hypothetical predicted protein [Mytilus galloprovincialis]|uniref:Uncharacterized protein n=1 Tax=Mytilus galloprovincialis TaxID=29158 RepID=A0A8B6D055_MYTGA|nr:Hypothetical predicted protein [Mytilus galloprovincialis]
MRASKKDGSRIRTESLQHQDIFNAVAEGCFMLAKILINHGFDINSISCYGESLLITLCRTSSCENEENLSFARFLLNEGSCVLSKDKFGRTALYYAERNGLQKITKEIKHSLQNSCIRKNIILNIEKRSVSFLQKGDQKKELS